MSENRQPGPAGRSPTVADVLALPVLAGGDPRVVTGAEHLGRPVRWVHVTELTDPASFLKGGELVLTTGMPLPDDPAGVRRYVDELAAVGAAALVIELVRRYHRPPDALVRACRARGLPLVTLARDVNFLEVTQVVHTLIVGHQADAIRRTQRVHEAFTALTLRGAGPEEVLRAAAEMSGRTVVLENLVHLALVCEPSGTTVRAALADWERRSRTTPATDRAEVSGPEGWLAAPVEYQGERWGRVVMLPAALPGRVFGPEDVTVLERTAMALTIARLTHSTPWERTAHRNALRDLVEQRHRSPADARARVAALGLPAEQARFVAVLADLPPSERDTGAAETRLSEELTATGERALVGLLSPTRLVVLLALRPSRPWREAVEEVSRTVLDAVPGATVSAGAPAEGLADAARSRPAVPSTNGPTSGCAACCTRCATTSASRSTRNGCWARCSTTTPGTAPISWRPCAAVWTRPATRRWPPVRPVCRGRRSTNGCVSSSGCSAATSSPASSAPNSTWPCTPSTRCGHPRAPAPEGAAMSFSPAPGRRGTPTGHESLRNPACVL
ncbi:purine catabolism regulator [Streptomyces ambofaciens]